MEGRCLSLPVSGTVNPGLRGSWHQCLLLPQESTPSGQSLEIHLPRQTGQGQSALVDYNHRIYALKNHDTNSSILSPITQGSYIGLSAHGSSRSSASASARILRSGLLGSRLERLQHASLRYRIREKRHTCVVQASAATLSAGSGGEGANPAGNEACFDSLSLPLATKWAPIPLPLPPPPKDTSLFAVIPFLWSLAAGDPSLRWRLAAALVLLVLGKVSGLAGPLLFKKALDSFTDAKSLTSAALYAAIGAVVASAASKAVSAVSNELRNVVFTPVGQATGRRVEFWFFSHILSMDMGFHLERKTGALARIIERGKRSITMIFRAVVFTFIPTIVELCMVCYLLARELSPSFAAVVLLTFLAYIAWTIALTKASVARRKELNRLDQLTTGKVVDILLNYETVLQFNNQQLDLQHYDSLLLDYQRAAVHLEYVSAALNGGQSTIIAIGLAAVMAMAGIRIGQGTMTVGDLVLVNGLVLQISLPLQFLGFLYRDLRQSLVDIEAVFEMLGMDSKLQDGTKKLPWTTEGVRVKAVDVEFAYSSSPTRKVLNGVSFTAEPGQSVAVVGPSGSGKSTIVKLLLRLYDPDKGALFLDGHDLRDLTQDSLRRAVAVVPQDTVLFNDTIFYNIGYGRPSATREEIEQAAMQAKLHEAIMRMPDGYETIVGERGLKLSGGEKQRVAIARAFLKSPRLLICDEATSALDSATEAGILKSLKELAAGRTCIFVAHRLSTIKHCDKILVMEAGRLLEEGTHEDLLRAKGAYSHMWSLQESQTPLRPKGEINGSATNGSAVRAREVDAANRDGEGGTSVVRSHTEVDPGEVTDEDILSKERYDEGESEFEKAKNNVGVMWPRGGEEGDTDGESTGNLKVNGAPHKDDK